MGTAPRLPRIRHDPIREEMERAALTRVGERLKEPLGGMGAREERLATARRERQAVHIPVAMPALAMDA